MCLKPETGASPLTNAMMSKELTKAAPRNLEVFGLKQQSSAMLLLTSMRWCKSGIAVVLFPEHTTNSRAI